MVNSADGSSPRHLRCPRCGAGFDCDPRGACWCAAEAVRLPLPADAAQGCLCPRCLRAAAAQGGEASSLPRRLPA